jgi:hypothetical protein
MSSIIRLEGMHAATASHVGWIETGQGPACYFCKQPAALFKPVAKGPGGVPGRLWWCPPVRHHLDDAIARAQRGLQATPP